jgi:hypothetical protein
MGQIRALAPQANRYLVLLNVAAYSTLVWQLAFPLFAWRQGLGRILLLCGAMSGWIGTACIYQMPLFGPAIAIGCLAFLSNQELELVAGGWRRFSALLEGKQRQEGPIVRQTAPVLAARGH